MCYTVYLSTTADDDFSTAGNGLFVLYRVAPGEDEDAVSLLRYPNRWYLESKYGGCSCHYRHSCEQNGDDFHPLEDWRPEDPEDVESTWSFYDLVKEVVSRGHRLDLVDLWSSTPNERTRSLDVSLADVPRETFVFFENARFDLYP